MGISYNAIHEPYYKITIPADFILKPYTALLPACAYHTINCHI